MAPTKKKTEGTATEQKVTPNSLRSRAEREVLEAHRDEYYQRAEALFTEAGLEFKRRTTPEERAQKKAADEQAKARKKLDDLLAKHPELASEIQSAAPTAATGSLELTGDLSNTGAVGA